MAFYDPVRGYNIASSHYKQGASVVFHAAGGSGDGLFKAAEEAKALSIGVDSDQGLIYASAAEAATKARAKFILTSMLKRVDNAVFLTGKDLVEKGRLAGGYRSFGLKEDGVGVAENQFNKALLAPVKAQIANLRKQIIDGKIAVPDENSDMAAWAKTLK